jgi:hypothetical protein
LAVLVSFSCSARGNEDALLSVSASEALTQRVIRIVPTAPAERAHNYPELVGCALIGVWAMYKSRRRWIF